ncbi:para-nitrobenzyl esterase [Streptomyces sp. 3213]|uniref:carboxylesterase/lipase family protein n=1 Tax=Streptomyces sp. 3213.3 TaxID=1855348 RepID=UPI00089700CC|nr:carboxylesterase family protein [Streptomyces sp. 3213.3]SEC43653.1 para-nitrobenzyl esterase [Streptomyces sp. 3213] [Streptomyces sp. 3213.3]
MTASRTRTALGGVLILSLTAVGLLSATPSAATSASTATVVPTDKGSVRGAVSHGVERFVGIPYAAAPTGPLRWKPPRPAARWTGVREATAFGNPCPVLPSGNGPRSETEDCLDINVWRPAAVRAGARLPVHVFIHGGGLTNGSGAQNDESKLVRETGVIGVSLNYRLGVFGFLGLPALTKEGGESGNYGFMDQQAALRWVQRNIAAFGGNPAAVTVDGESAGGWSVCGHLVSPGSRGLFARAVIQSGSCPSVPEAQAETAGTAFARQAGCDSTDLPAVLGCLRSTSVGALLDASRTFSAGFVNGTPTFPVNVRQAVDSGHFTRVTVLVGANRDEGRTFAQGYIGAGKEAYLAFVQGVAGDRADEVLARYPWPETSDAFTAAYLVGAIMTDSGLVGGIGGCGQRSLVRAFGRYTPTYSYEFDHRTGPGLTQIPGYVWGAGHAAELAYIWPSFDNGTPIAPLFNAAERRLAREMTQYWGAFTRTGRPHVVRQNAWPAYHPGKGLTLSLRAGGRSALIDDAQYSAEHQCSLWDTMAVTDRS